MKNKLERFGNSSFGYHLINWVTYLLYRFLSLFYRQRFAPQKIMSPVLIAGLFRSGTSITASIIKSFDFSNGPDAHILKSNTGDKKEYLENYFFMDLSMYLFFKTYSWGDDPPLKSDVEKIDLKNENKHDLARFSLLKIHDSRISNYNKVKVLLKNDMTHPEFYAGKYFSSRSFIKNPHFSVLLPYFKILFPESKIIFVFKDPAKAVESAKKVSSRADYNLYFKYYNEAVEEHKNNNSKIIFLSYDYLITNPELSIQKLADEVGVKNCDAKKIIHKIDRKINETKNWDDAPEKIKQLYNYMLKSSINKTND